MCKAGTETVSASSVFVQGWQEEGEEGQVQGTVSNNATAGHSNSAQPSSKQEMDDCGLHCALMMAEHSGGV